MSKEHKTSNSINDTNNNRKGDKKVKKIQDRNTLYDTLRYYVDFILYRSYKEIKYVGLEKIPKDGAVIIAPNHTNALMDALVVLGRYKGPTVFVARADIFKNPKLAKIFNFLKIMPIMRIRDGVGEVKKNDETIQKSIEVLLDKVPFCILPEGTHRAKHSLLPLGKGIFRIALQTQELLGDTPLYIVPFGLEYGNFFRFRSTVLVQVGNPINILEYVRNHPNETIPIKMNNLKEILSERMKEVIVYIPDDDYYEATYELCAIMNNQYSDEYVKTHPNQNKRSLTTMYHSNKEIVADIQRMCAQNKEKSEELFQIAREIKEIRDRHHISLSTLTIKYPFLSRLIKNLIFFITLPYSIPAGIITLPLTGIIALVLSKFKDKAFFNSIRYVITLIIWPIILIIYSAILFTTLPWEWALLGLAAATPAPFASQDSYRLLRIMISDFKYSLNPELKAKVRKVRELYNSLNLKPKSSKL